MSQEILYRIIFQHQDQRVELHARSISQGGAMYAFVEVSEILFDERTSVLVDPSEEKLKAEFGDVERTYIPLQSVIRIDQVNKRGPNRIVDQKNEGGNITPFAPLPPGDRT